ncbi:P-loop containing nucleoside triphosphate hydrolase protein [Tribonema minus]|uniref:P-loop containing nucleoside triphosphate hydrolase protein n=1 Tax=Tribonema minus TaxID=303371 RepID=A0A836C8L3_9STRA|nr:P-loop containing nucleoside triphosphate hydrolase protein [Tribonema minus]
MEKMYVTSIALRVHTFTPPQLPQPTSQVMTKRVAQGCDTGAITKKQVVGPYTNMPAKYAIDLAHAKTNEQMLEEDADNCERFVAMELHDGDIHVLHAGAGAGKTTLAIRLMKSISTRYRAVEAMALTFNVAAAVDSEAKVNGAERLAFKTIDSFLYALYSDEIKGAMKVDFNVTDEVMEMVHCVLKRRVTPEEARSYGDQLETACNRGTCTGLGAVARQVWNEGMKGTWWSHSMLRVRARDDPRRRWVEAMKRFKLIIVDEAQDLNLVMISMMRQIHHAATMVYIGDSAQAIYGFMECTDVKHTLQQQYIDWTLYTTFRFGQKVCDYVNERRLCVSPAVAHPQNFDTTIEVIDNIETIMPGPHTVLLPSAWDKRLFKKVDKLKALEILGKINLTDASESIVLSTVHGYKGLEAERVVVTCSVRNARNDDELKLLYVAVTRARIAPSLVRAFAGVHHIHFPPIPVTDDAAAKTVNAVLLPGYGVAASRYTSLAECLQAYLAMRNVSANVFLVKYASDVTSHLEAESRVKEIATKYENVIIIGHSQGAYLAEGIAKKFELPLVQWAGGAYDGKVCDFNNSILSLLCEHDSSHPCLRALTSGYDGHTHSVSSLPVKMMATIPDADHFHGVVLKTGGKDVSGDAMDIAERIGAFASYIFFRDEEAGGRLGRDAEYTSARSSTFLDEQRFSRLSAWCTCRQEDVSFEVRV